MIRAVFHLAFWLSGLWTAAGELQYKPARIDNPLKGLIGESYSSPADFPHSLQYVQNSLARLMKGPHEFDWSEFDSQLLSVAAGGRQAVIRIWIDWPGQPTGVPKFLLEQGIRTNAHLNAFAWRHGEVNPDFDDPKLRAAIQDFIAAFGQRYDARPEIGFIEAGLLGTWGEWLRGSDSLLSKETELEVIAAYKKAFRTTKILYRFPNERTESVEVGFHNDWFGRWGMPYVTKNWAREPVGGRIFPELKSLLFRKEPTRQMDDALQAEIRNEHLTYLRLGVGFGSLSYYGQEEAALKTARTLGYELFAREATIENGAVSVTITNLGCAPFYYRWPIEVALARDGHLMKVERTDWDIRSIVPGKGMPPFTHTFDRKGIPPGEVQVLMRVVNPLPRGQSLSFANEAQDSITPGWLPIGSWSN